MKSFITPQGVLQGWKAIYHPAEHSQEDMDKLMSYKILTNKRAIQSFQ